MGSDHPLTEPWIAIGVLLFSIAAEASRCGSAYEKCMNTRGQYTRRVIIAVSIAALYIVAWWLSDVFILLFGGLILATALRAGAARIARSAPIPEQGALAVVVVGIIALLAALFWLVGGRVAMQFEELRITFPQALATAREWLHASPFGLMLLDLVESAKDSGVPWSRVAIFTTVAIGGVVNAILMVALGLYLAASPDMYYQGLLRIVPKNARPSTWHFPPPVRGFSDGSLARCSR